jgi:hypothetical protein
MRRHFLAFASASLLAVTGCSAGDGASDVATSDPETSASTPAAVREPALDPLDPACLVGDWRITQAEMQGFYDAATGSSEGFTITIEGDTGLSFTVDQYRYTPSFTLILDVSGLRGEGVTTGSLGGSYAADGGLITTTLGDNNLATTITINGAAQDASGLVGSIIASDPINQAPFDCSDPQSPVLQFEVGEGVRTPVALTAAGS